MQSYVLAVLLLATPLSTWAQGNGADRGGGDEYSAEVFNIARGITKKLRKWAEDGTLALTEDQMIQVEKLFDLNLNPKPPLLLEVYSFERVYKHPEKITHALGTPELQHDLELAQETTLINRYSTQAPNALPTAPRIEVGRLRWDALKGKPDDKEFMVLHELLGAAGILKDGERLDNQFAVSYQLKLAALKDWSDFKESFKISLISAWITLGRTLDPKLTEFEDVGEYLQTIKAYDSIFFAQTKYLDMKKVDRARREAYQEIKETYDRQMALATKIARRRRADQMALAQAQIARIRAEFNPPNKTWKALSDRILDRFVEGEEAAQLKVNELSDGSVFEAYIQDRCFSTRYTLDSEQYRTQCLVDRLTHGDFRKHILPLVNDQNDAIFKLFNESLYRVDKVVDPQEIQNEY